MHWIGFWLDCRGEEGLRRDNTSETRQMRILRPNVRITPHYSPGVYLIDHSRLVATTPLGKTNPQKGGGDAGANLQTAPSLACNGRFLTWTAGCSPAMERAKLLGLRLGRESR